MVAAPRPNALLAAQARPLRIAHVSATFPPYFGGTGTVCLNNARELVRRGHRAQVFTARPPATLGGTDDPAGIPVHRLWSPVRVGNVPFTPSLIRALRGFDLVHLHFPYYLGAELTWLAAKLYQIPYVVTYHQDTVLPGIGGRAAEVHHSTFGSRILRDARLVLPTTLDYAQSSRRLGSLYRKNPARFVPLPNGVDVRRFRPGQDSRDLQQRYGLSADSRVILFVGALDRPHYFKGVDVLLRAAAHLTAGEWHVLVVGDGELKDVYQRQAIALGIGDRVTFCGRVADGELALYFALADVVTLPSRTAGEAFGVVLIEAMASGIPVVASRLPGVRSVVDDGVNGFLVEPGNVADLAEQLDRLLNDSSLRHRFGVSGRAKAEAFYDWGHIGVQLEAIYRRVLADHAVHFPVDGGDDR